ncbi:FG-GAP-like repeat-containing protein [Anaeromyxobacter oryzae]|uniref:CARDB domain-containing protein n=1 Tax=Anaeromyxobacter oryzae TaxID=2918170 RepID=A0ABM7WUC6_9BACT|nr:FG-GAP-like repeat-containing protein [Anaeromyxobacter oryzae]BDG03091.1 hypothetical protein AMOR_20870 [Anaeromyxobacter oryzae]
MRLDRYSVLAAAVLLAGCPGSSKKDCPSGQVRQGGTCVAPLCAAGSQECGSTCCAADQTCAEPGVCRGNACTDSGSCAAGQTCKAGSCTSYDPTCRFVPEKGPFAPRVAWQWTGSKVMPDYRDVLMTPVVVPISPPTAGDLFTPPAVVFNSIRGDLGAAEEVPGVMRAVRGDDGADLWTSDPSHLVNGLTGIAAGDLHGDGHMVFVTGRFSGFDPTKDGVVAFDDQGRFLWETIGPRIRWGAPTMANLTGGPRGNVIVGATVLDADGNVLCQGKFGEGQNFMGPISVVADVDLDGKPEIVAGNTVYDASCNPKPGWPAKQKDGSLWDDGLVAIADFTGDSHPEIVVVGVGQVRMHDWQGNLIWGPIAIPGGGGGPPTIADFDGDGKLEIGVAAKLAYTVFKPFAKNPILWSRPTQDHSEVTGSSVFDFMNDGHSQVVYGDECYTHIYDGHTGDSLFEAVNPSCTTQENPVIADVNRDGRAEIVVATNSVCAYQCPWGNQYDSGMKGITVYKDLNDRWVGTRPMWNQHAYSVTNVEDDGKLPWPIPNFWQMAGLNAFRKNPVGDPNYSAPDLAAEAGDVVVDTSACPRTLSVTVRVWNRGAVPAAEGIPVTFRADPGGALYGTVLTKTTILPGRSEDVTLRIDAPPRQPTGVVVELDRDASGNGVVGECDQSNNVVHAGDAFCVGSSL